MVIPIVLLTVNPWLGIVNVKTPDVEAYPALVAVCVPPVLSVIELIPELTNLCSNSKSSTETVTPIPEAKYPDPTFKSA